jgi:exosortase A-associated hydrolase 2
LDLTQEPVSLEIGGVPVRGISYQPPSPARTGLVLCDPFAEEKKSSENTLAALGRALAAGGFSAWHYDYRGTGDSGGDFEQFALEEWRDDLRAVIEQLRALSGLERVGLVGLRLGATLAAEIAPVVGACCLVLWEPLFEGRRYVRELNQRTAIKGMLTGSPREIASSGESRVAGSERSDQEGMDLGGYLLTPALLEQLGALRLAALPDLPALILECNGRGQVTTRAQALVAEAPQAQAQALVLEPFWQRVGLVNTSPLITATVQWLASLEADYG